MQFGSLGNALVVAQSNGWDLHDSYLNGDELSRAGARGGNFVQAKRE